ncbi:tRNA(Ile)-lysidine synthase [Thiomonas sp. X19]|uniref:tRNA lysidine(34) synthetase TilS n=1 Tax=Thiomonas sp. X19 TaxID=1050370 RepID=UPI000B6405B8|nr:tRNA lysidine(34) synthetase TilS [Thiomonas sp. X19]SCC95392.1 tRNA(Ile)-lysidine synthase [Thiomonas sp. X19]
MPAAQGSQADPALVALRSFVRRHAALGAAPAPVAIAFSGGADSTALLLAALQRWGPARLRALHVHHGLQSGADAFADHVRKRCAAWNMPCTVLPVQVQAQRGDSLEDKARDARYRALGEAARGLGCDWLLLGHQADDQAESLLLALLRGAGPKGLAAMPEATQRDGLWLGRPLLACSAEALRQSLDARALPYLRDPMNHDPAFRRSRIRHELLPVIARLEPAWRSTLARSAALCAHAAASIEEMAALDLARCAAPDGLGLGALRELSDARLGEVLRLWLRQAGLRSNHGQIDNLRRQVRATARGAMGLQVRLEAATLERRGGCLVRVAPAD